MNFRIWYDKRDCKYKFEGGISECEIENANVDNAERAYLDRSDKSAAGHLLSLHLLFANSKTI